MGARKKGKGTNHTYMKIAHVCRYVVVAFVVTFVAIEVDRNRVLMEEAGDWSMGSQRVPRRYAFVVRISRVRRYVMA